MNMRYGFLVSASFRKGRGNQTTVFIKLLLVQNQRSASSDFFFSQLFYLDAAFKIYDAPSNFLLLCL